MFGLEQLHNVLPPLKPTENYNHKSNATNWRPSNSIVSSKLLTRLTEQIKERKTLIDSRCIPHYIGSEASSDNDTITSSDLVLNRASRGEIIPINQICIPCSKETRKSQYSCEKLLPEHIYEISNHMMDVRMTVFVSTSRKINHKILSFNETCTLRQDAFADSNMTSTIQSNKSTNSFSFLTMHDAAITFSEADSIEEFDFQPGPIGLELIMQNDRVVCKSVIENSQAYELYGDLLVGAEILSVNHRRVTDLASFRDVVNMNQHSDLLLILVRRNKVLTNLTSLTELVQSSLPDDNPGYPTEKYHGGNQLRRIR